jgi:hypothetical protein
MKKELELNINLKKTLNAAQKDVTIKNSKRKEGKNKKFYRISRVPRDRIEIMGKRLCLKR